MNTVPKQNIWTEKIHQRNERIKGLELESFTTFWKA